MRWPVAVSFRFRASSCLLLCIALDAIGPATARSNAQCPVILRPASGSTPLSAQIRAQAAYVAAYGQMVESVATARQINAQAVALEIQNSVSYVDAYFKGRELNREWRAKENPNYLEREKKRQEVLARRIEEQYQDLLKGDVTSPLNWLLRELSGPVVAYRYLPPDQTLVHSQLDQGLNARDLEQIRLSDGGSKASRLVFAAGDGKVLQPHWPLGLRGEECATARESYERTLDNVVAEIKAKGQASHENQTKVMQDVNALFVVLEDVYPKERRKDPTEFLAYATAKRFLQSSLASTHRAITTTDRKAIGGGLAFRGDSVVGLLQHMYETGLEFAPPEPGGEGVYKSLFQNLRALYLKIGPNQPAVDVRKRFVGDAETLPGGNKDR